MITPIRKYFFIAVHIIVWFILLSGCTPKPGEFHEGEYTPDENRLLKQLNETNRLFSRMEGVDLVLYLSEDDVSDLLSDSFERFTEHFTQLDAAGFSKVVFGNFSVELAEQHIGSKVDFSFEVDALKRRINGHLHSMHSIRAGKDEFVLSTNFDEIILDGFVEQVELEKNSENKKIISASIQNFLHMLNVEIVNMPLNIPVNMNILNNVNGKDVYYSTDYTLHSAKAINMRTKMQMYLPYINRNGISFLGASKLVENLDYTPSTELCQLRRSLKNRIDSQLRKTMGINFDALQQYSSYYVSKAYLSKQMNFALEDMDLRVIKKFFIKISKEDRHFAKGIYLFDKGSLPLCTGVQEDCTGRLKQCERECEKTYGLQSCQECEGVTNPFSHVRCMSALEKCKSKEQLHLYECQKRETRCEEENIQIQNSCEIENLTKVSVCKEKKAALQFEQDHLLLGDLALEMDVKNSYAVQRVRNIRFNQSLSEIEVTRNLHASMDSRLMPTFHGVQLDDMNCSLQMNEALLTHSKIDLAGQRQSVSLVSQRDKDGRLLLQAISEPYVVDLTLDNAPYEKLIGRPDFTLSCRYQGMLLAGIDKEKLLAKRELPHGTQLLLSHIELGFEEESFTFPISPIRIGTEIILYPTMENQAIGFSRQALFY